MAFKILVVDDEPDVLQIVSNRLAREGFAVERAADGEEALSKFYEFDPDLVLLDLVMPKLNGFEVLKQIREKYSDRWRPVIIISANAELETLHKCYDMEADHYLTKPCSMEVILKGIATMRALISQRAD
ncbi:MAG: response regulator [Candidatus Omnitrophica bacterium]|jgi:two-component system response regulator VicR|nr:response regulator [Candidatus Omnitrophota bacterium]